MISFARKFLQLINIPFDLIQFQLPLALSDLETKKMRAIQNIQNRLDFLLSTEDMNENEDVLRLQLEMISKLDETVK